MRQDYREFLTRKAPKASASGLDRLPSMHAKMKPHQRDATEFCLRQGRAGMFLDTGLGKTFCELEFSKYAAEATNGMALILTPLAVAKQIEREAATFGYDARVIRDQSQAKSGINICNYDRLDKLDPDAFGSVTLDESSILKSFTGKTTRALIAAFAGHRFRLAATATPAPNDHMELGNHSDFLGIMPQQEMLSRWFVNDTSDASQTWRLKGHAVEPFWDWMASWARMAETPADMGHDASEYVLPAMNVINHRSYGTTKNYASGTLFAADVSATNMFDLKRQTSSARAKLAAQVVFGVLGCLPKISETNGTHRDVRDTPATLNIETSKRLRLEPPTDAIQSDTSTENSKRRLGSKSKITAPSSGTKTAPAPSAGRETPGDTNTSASTIATKRAELEVSSASIATTASGNSETTPTTSGKPLVISTHQMPESWVLWCDTNDEQDALEAELGDIAISIRGSQSTAEKEELHDAWLAGARPVLISKSSIFGYGMNWQHCHNMLFVGRSFSYESYYQAVRRCWRFGQLCAVNVHIIVAEGEDQIGRVIDRKSADHQMMKRAMADAMRRSMGRESKTRLAYEPNHTGRLPAWLSAA